MKTSSGHHIAAIIIVLLIYLISLKNTGIYIVMAETYYITPGPMSLCPNKPNPCLSLNQYASQFQNLRTNITLAMLPGKHHLELSLAVFNTTSLMIIATKFYATSLYCKPYDQIHILFSGVKYISMINLKIFGCAIIDIDNQYFVLEDSQIQDVYVSGFAGLTLMNVEYGEIESALFHSISNNIYGCSDLGDHNTSGAYHVGGAVVILDSHISMTKTLFVNNSAEESGAIFLYHSVTDFTGCIFIDNKALTFGGAIETENSSIQIYNGFFSGNAAILSGIFLFHDSIVYITNSTISDSITFGVGGVVVHVVKSKFELYESIVSNSTAHYFIIQTSGSEVIFNNDTFSNNIVSNGTVFMQTSVSSFKNVVFYDHNSAFAQEIFKINTIREEHCNSGIKLSAQYSFVNITNCSFLYNGFKNSCKNGAMDILMSFFRVENSIFDGNGTQSGLYIVLSNFTMIECFMTNFVRRVQGGAMVMILSNIVMKRNNFNNNTVKPVCIKEGSAAECDTVHNTQGGSVYIINSNALIEGCSFLNNKAIYGGAIYVQAERLHYNKIFQDHGIDNNLQVTMVNVTFVENTATQSGGAIFISRLTSTLNIVNTTFKHNRALKHSGGSIYSFKSNLTITGLLNVQNSTGYLGAVYFVQSNVAVDGTFTFINNTGSFFALSCNVILSGESYFLDNSNHYKESSSFQEGGALTLFQSHVSFFGKTNVLSNQAKIGGAILATESTIDVFGNMSVARNRAWLFGGGIYAYKAQLNFIGHTTLIGNLADKNGGGMYMISSTCKLLNNSLMFVGNTAGRNGGGIFLEQNSKLVVTKDQWECLDKTCGKIQWLAIDFINNSADYGGAVYVNDYTMSGNCGTISQSLTMECFCQVLSTYPPDVIHYLNTTLSFLNDTYHALTIDSSFFEPDPLNASNFVNIRFNSNAATARGASLYGGLLDRCSISPFSEILNLHTNLTAIPYSILNITDIQLDDITSDPVRVCFCVNNQPDCEYQPPTQYVKKGHTLKISTVAVDQVNNSAPGKIRALLNGGLSDNQLIQHTTENCTELKYNILSTKTSEQLKLYAEGPCKDIGKSQHTLNVEFLPCTCPIGFQLTDSENNCKCECDTRLYPCISNCSTQTESVLRESECWFSFVNTTSQTGYVIHPHCPFKYCYSPTQPVKVNLNIPDGADAQCTFNHSGKLCGLCQDGLSFSFGTSHCVLCSNKWLLLLIPFSLVGILLVVFLLVCRLNVSTGTLNGFIFYANIVTANHALFLPFERPNFITVFIAWLNLDFGFKTCFYNGMDAYTNTWLQFAFPSYVIFLVAMIIVISEHSNRFVRLIHRTRPIAALSTLIFLSYTKFLRTIIAVLSFTTLEYPDGSHEIVWLLDANVAYLQGKHIPLFIAAVLVFLVGVMFTSFLFFWQWILALNDRLHLAKWINSGKLFAVMESFQNPLKVKHRYWTGLLLLGRVVMYTVSSLNVFGDPSVNLYSVIIVTLSILLLKLFANSVYKRWSVDFLESIFIILLCTYAASTLFVRETAGNQEALAYFTNVIVLIMTMVILVSHVYMTFSESLKTFFQSQRTRREPISDLPLVDFAADQFQQEMEPSITEVEPPVAMDTDESPMDNDSEEEVSDEGAPLLKTY